MKPERGDASSSAALMKQRERTERILDTASALLLRWGYKRITIDDIARHSGIGKGTIYLHWKTRESLFESLMLRETILIMEELIGRIRSDPAEVLLHRLMRSLLLITLERPLARALFTRDIDLLGKLAESSVSSELQTQQNYVFDEYLTLLRDRGLMRNDIPLSVQSYAFNATVTGFLLIDSMLVGEDRLAIEEKAQALAMTIQLAFEPASPPAPHAVQEVASRMSHLFEQINASCKQQMKQFMGM
ncbi:MAG: TetR/AcrR family transcriptional regulator [Ktedonobacteraceae bacterium]|nr:TetR/AcrR family transcriptional regulator [Ktedonobacteraceae bacterium]